MTVQMSNREFVKLGALQCPFCRSWKIEGSGDSEFGDEYAVNEVTCHDCWASWTDDYKLVGYTVIDEPEEEEEDSHGAPAREFNVVRQIDVKARDPEEAVSVANDLMQDVDAGVTEVLDPLSAVRSLTARELAQVLASLRYVQADKTSSIQSVLTGMAHFDGIEEGPLDNDEIDELCERLNLGG